MKNVFVCSPEWRTASTLGKIRITNEQFRNISRKPFINTALKAKQTRKDLNLSRIWQESAFGKPSEKTLKKS
jgi:hypothetical protein